MSSGYLYLSEGEALSKARQIKSIAVDIETTLNKIDAELNKINNSDSDLYRGTQKAYELSSTLLDFRKHFSEVYTEIEKESIFIEKVVDVSQKQ